LTPTDPIICAAIIGTYTLSSFHTLDSEELHIGGKFAKKHVPVNLRQILSAESAANDGLAYPFLTLALYLTLDGANTTAFKHWFLIGWLCRFVLFLSQLHSLICSVSDQVCLGVILGAILGS
jgi:NhaP-type Na+/H+ or K+/H+ antiporter